MLGRFVPTYGPGGQIHLSLQGTNLYVTEADMIPVQEHLVRLMTETSQITIPEDLQ